MVLSSQCNGQIEFIRFSPLASPFIRQNFIVDFETITKLNMYTSIATSTRLVFENKFMKNNFPGICTNSFFACFARRAAIVGGEKLVFAPTSGN